jgi:23S rRNA pseudouridine2605 synthase/16S rRNA pseudouridine516 synthase
MSDSRGSDHRKDRDLVPDVVIDWSGPDTSSNQRSGDSPTSERLQKVLAAAGVASRRVCENLIVAGRVSVNGKVVTELGSRVEPATDQVAVDGVAVQLDTTKRYIMLNKPTGVVSSMADENGRPDLREFTRDYDERLFNVGRLDGETSGLLLLTNDGPLANVLAHPRYGVEKTYIAKVTGSVQAPTLRKLKEGIELDDGPIAVDSVRVLGAPSQGHSMVELTLHSGRNRIVRRLMAAVGHPVVELVRRQFGPLHLGTLASGQTRELTDAERGALLTIAREHESAGGPADDSPDADPSAAADTAAADSAAAPNSVAGGAPS